jgi:hypothetical protein
MSRSDGEIFPISDRPIYVKYAARLYCRFGRKLTIDYFSTKSLTSAGFLSLTTTIAILCPMNWSEWRSDPRKCHRNSFILRLTRCFYLSRTRIARMRDGEKWESNGQSFSAKTDRDWCPVPNLLYISSERFGDVYPHR